MAHHCHATWARGLGAAAVSCLLLGSRLPARAQNASQTAPTSVSPRSQLGAESASADPNSHNGLRLEHLREDERRKRLQADMVRLQTLTSELKAEVDNTAKDELSITVVRKAMEIEKLARDIRERMRD